MVNPITWNVTVKTSDLCTAFYNAVLNSYMVDPREERLPARIGFGTESGLPRELRVPVTDLWGQFGSFVEIPHEGGIVRIQVPNDEAIRKELCRIDVQWRQPVALKLDAFLSDMIGAAGQKRGLSLRQFQLLVPEAAQERWSDFEAWVEACLNILKQKDFRHLQKKAADMVHSYAAGRLMIASGGNQIRRIIRADLAAGVQHRLIPLTPEGQANIEAQLTQRDKAGLLEQREAETLLEIYWLYHFEKRVFPGEEQAAVWRFLPAPIRMPGAHTARAPAPADPQEQVVARGPVLHPPEPQAAGDFMGGLVRVHPDDPVYQKPRVAFYIANFAAKAVYRTKFFKREDYLAIPLRADSGALMVVLVCPEEGHAADHFFLAGNDNDPPDDLLRWTGPAQWNRWRLVSAEPRPEQYLGRACHENPAAHERTAQEIIAAN